MIDQVVTEIPNGKSPDEVASINDEVSELVRSILHALGFRAPTFDASDEVIGKAIAACFAVYGEARAKDVARAVISVWKVPLPKALVYAYDECIGAVKVSSESLEDLANARRTCCHWSVRRNASSSPKTLQRQGGKRL